MKTRAVGPGLSRFRPVRIGLLIYSWAMATIVTNIDIGGRYILLGGGFGSDRIERPHVLFGNMAPSVDDSQYSLVLVASESGAMGWMEVSKMRLVSVDGLSPSDALAEPTPQDEIR